MFGESKESIYKGLTLEELESVSLMSLRKKVKCHLCKFTGTCVVLSAENRSKLRDCLAGQSNDNVERLQLGVTCLVCIEHIQEFSNFRNIFLQLEAEFQHSVDNIAKSVKSEKLPLSDYLQKWSSKTCRLCFQASSNKTRLKPSDSFIKIINQCLPECNIDLTETIHLCKTCQRKIWQFNNFLGSILPSQKQILNSAINLIIPTGKRGRSVVYETDYYFLTKNLPNRELNKYNFSDVNVAYKCPACPDPVGNFADLSKHIKIHFSRKQCWKCGHAFQSQYMLRKHLNTHRMISYEILAKLNTPLENELDLRVVSHEICGPFKCVICGETRPNYKSFHGHVQLSHMDEAISKCSKCDLKIGFESLFEAQLHFAEVHEIYDLFEPPPVQSVQSPLNTSETKELFCCGDCVTYFNSIDEMEQHSCVSDSAKNNQQISADVTQNKVFNYEDLSNLNETCNVEVDTNVIEESFICESFKFQCQYCQMEVESLDVHQCANFNNLNATDTNKVVEESLPEGPIFNETSIQHSNELSQNFRNQSKAQDFDTSNKICCIERVEGGNIQESHIYLHINMQQSQPSPITPPRNNFTKQLKRDEFNSEEPLKKKRKSKYKYSKTRNNCIVVFDDDD